MLTAPLVILAALAWLGLLFGAALWGERRPAALENYWRYVYALSLAVYCTSWTFFGTVTQALRSGWAIPPTFVGTIALYLLGFGLLRKLVALARERHSTSLADLIATRLGKSSMLAAAVTLVAVLGIVPYIALQLKAVTMSYALLTNSADPSPPAWQDGALYVALAMALFAMLFGTRRASAMEHNRGLVLAMAVESLLKLGVMLALGVFVWRQGVPAEIVAALPHPQGASGFPALILLGALAMFTLPHQFHVGTVECKDLDHLRTARWLFPLYLLLIALPILPLARAGAALLGPLGIPSDLYVLALPLHAGNETLALFAFLGGLSAATGMLILATLALSVMIGNHWLTPLLLRGPWSARVAQTADLRPRVLRQRRAGILAVMLLAWAYSRAIAGNDALADIGAVSFSALATLAPALGFAVWRPATPPRAVAIGLAVAVVVWAWVLLAPVFGHAWGVPAAWLQQGPFGFAWLAPDTLFGLHEWSPLGRAVALSLGLGTATTLLVATLGDERPAAVADALPRDTLAAIAARFLAGERLAQLQSMLPNGAAGDAEFARTVERELAAVLGAASARLLLDAARREPDRDLDTVATLVGEASQALRFNQRLLEAALENMSQGISVVDADLNLVAWNRQYAERFDYPPDLLRVGTPIEALLRWNLARDGGSPALEAAIARRMAHMRAGTPYVAERRFSDSRTFEEHVIEIRGNPMPDGGFVATFTDVTPFRHAEAELKRVAESLEQRVTERTGELQQAKAVAERANQAKSRFLAAVSHDLAQPLNAAQLFTHALAQQLERPAHRVAVGQIEGALGSAEDLLSGLLDISRLDAGGLAPRVVEFRLDDVLQPLAAEFRVLADQKGLALHAPPCRAWVRSDPQLLRRVLQNFLANAVRYTAHGKILLGVRRRGDELEVQVIDTGPGIAVADQRVIFEEFRRLDRGGQGLGLGLAIAERVAGLLGHRLGLRSRLGRGTVFALHVPRVATRPVPIAVAATPAANPPGTRVLVVDNDGDVLRGMQALLTGWDCEVLAARDGSEALRLARQAAPALALLDYHLDGGDTGLRVWSALRDAGIDCPAVIITADHAEPLRREVQAAGAHLLHKPLKPLALKSLMARLAAARAVDG